MPPNKLDSYEREPISTTTLSLLCHFATGDVSKPLRPVEADWDQVFQAVCRNGLLGVTYHYLKYNEHREYPPTEFRSWVQQAYRLKSIGMVMMNQKVGRVLSQLNEAGLDYLLIKGPAIAHLIYPHHSLRSFNDLDIVVREQDWNFAHQMLTKIGFIQVEDKELLQPPPKLASQMVLYELKYWHPELRLILELHFDDLLNAGLAARQIEGFWQRSTQLMVERIPVKILALEDQLIHLCAHAHYHGYTRLNWFTDIAFIIRDYADKLDWGRFIETVHTEEAEVPVYYTLRFLAQLLEVSAPEAVVEAVKPDSWRRWWHERYMPEKQVLSMLPMPRPDFSFYFIPLFKRLLPDLLVMGRRREKLWCLIRLLAPPKAWLQYYYQLQKLQPIAAHYLLHPLKLLFNYLIEGVTVISKKQRLGIPGPELAHAREERVEELKVTDFNPSRV